MQHDESYMWRKLLKKLIEFCHKHHKKTWTLVLIGKTEERSGWGKNNSTKQDLKLTFFSPPSSHSQGKGKGEVSEQMEEKKIPGSVKDGSNRRLPLPANLNVCTKDNRMKA